jgi:probable F420-dependent oxidoreductase
MADHFMLPFSPLIALQAVADATTSIRLTQVVLAQGFRHPAVLAKELATLDVLSGGRVEIGIGAGWMGQEFDQAGIPFGRGPDRIARMEEAVHVLKGLFGDGPLTFAGQHFRISGLDGLPKPLQRPHPPVMIGGGGRQVLAAAARCADIIQLLPSPISDSGVNPSMVTPSAFRERLAWIEDAAGERFGSIEIGALMMDVVVTDDPETAERAFLDRVRPADDAVSPTREELLASPLVAIGSLEAVCEKLERGRAEFGISYLACPAHARMDVLAPVIERLAGR